METSTTVKPTPSVGSDRRDYDTFCPECGQPLDQIWHHPNGDFSGQTVRSPGLVVAGFLFLVLVGIRTWTAGDHLSSVERRAEIFAAGLSPTSMGPSGLPTIVGSDEEYQLLGDLVRSRNRERESPISALVALAVAVAVVGTPETLRANPRQPANHRAFQNMLERTALMMWQIAHPVSVAATVLFTLTYSWSVASLLFTGMAVSPILLDTAFSRTIVMTIVIPDLLIH